MSTTPRPQPYLVAHDTSVLAPASVGPVHFEAVIDRLQSDPSVSIAKVLSPRSLRAMSNGTSVTDQVISAIMPEAVAHDLAVAHPQLIVEEDALVLPHAPGPAALADLDPGILTPFGATQTWTLRVTDASQQPLPRALVMLFGATRSAEGKTDDDGLVSLTLLNETDETISAVYVNPESGCWSLWLDRPECRAGTVTTLSCLPLADAPGVFPDSEALGWGQRAMRLDGVPVEFGGSGVTVLVVDSGAAALTHPDLTGVRDGIDLVSVPANPDLWREDLIAHGSHCTGIISGARGGGGIRGFAPEANVLQARIFPGGRVSSLVDALDYAIDQGADLVNLSLGTGGSSQILLQKVAQAKEMGVACIVAAGNTAGPVRFPGTSPDVLTVAAIGIEGSFPDSSYHARQRWSEGQHDGAYFSAQFSCYGPEVDVCAPGVAITSSVPAAGYASWDGTSMATPHVTGLAALVLAHHPDFRSGSLAVRSAERVDRLFEILRASCTPMAFGDLHRSGAGMPDAIRALGLDGAGPPATTVDPGAAIESGLLQLRQSMIVGGLLPVPDEVEPPGLDRVGQIRRALAELASQMERAGLVTG